MSKLLELIQELPCSESHIFFDNGKWHITTEWLVGNFAGRSFSGATKDECLTQMSDYFDKHIGHDSMVGRSVTCSGWPNIDSVRRYCIKYFEATED